MTALSKRPVRSITRAVVAWDRAKRRYDSLVERYRAAINADPSGPKEHIYRTLGDKVDSAALVCWDRTCELHAMAAKLRKKVKK